VLRSLVLTVALAALGRDDPTGAIAVEVVADYELNQGAWV